jgi:hypothetical protein
MITVSSWDVFKKGRTLNVIASFYVLMTNDFHLLVEPAEVGDLGRFMESVGRRYVRYGMKHIAGPARCGRAV